MRTSGSSLPPTPEAAQVLSGYCRCKVKDVSLIPLNKVNLGVMCINCFLKLVLFIFICFCPSRAMIYWCLLSQLLQLCGEVMTSTFGRVKGTQNTADRDGFLIHSYCAS